MPVAFSRLTITTGPQQMQVLCIDAPDTMSRPESPVLLFLHGKGEFGPNPDYLPLVLRNMAPGYQAIQERLKNVTVVSPQVPSASDGWTWRDFVPALAQFLTHNYHGRRLVAAGFSRGGRGVLQLNAAMPGLISKWAIVDPQRADPDEEAQLLPRGPKAEGWLRYGNAIAANTPFAKKIADQLDDQHGIFADFKHGELAIKAFSGDKLNGAEHLYEYLKIDFV
jgi:pimeloyl-ACP methyl ester carboxylesterase